jgi:RNA 2',3'-cyclic 3'-phosphodiesterase
MSHYFLGVPLPEEVKTHLYEMSEHFKHRLDYGYWTDREDYHITLLFLGATTPKQLEEIQESLHARKQEMKPTELKLSGFGTFGKSDQPRVLWMGVQSDHFLYDDQSIVKECVVASGMQTESRPYKPHITVAKKWRGKSRLTQEDWGKIVPPFNPLTWTANEFRLFEVKPQHTPRYMPVHTFSLN